MIKYLLIPLATIFFAIHSHAQCSAPNTTISNGDATICSPTTYLLKATLHSNVSYQWKLNGTEISGATGSGYVANATGIYTVKVSYSDCTPFESNSVHLTVIPTPIANAGPDQYVLKNTRVNLHASGGILYLWVPSAGLSDPNTQNPTITISATTEFTVVVSDASNTCKSTDNVVIHVTNTTAVSKSQAQSGIKLFPNPTTESFHIEMPESGIDVSYEILDLTGLSVASGTFTSTVSDQKIATNFGAGMYQVVLKYNNVVTCVRLSKVQ